MKEEKHSYIKGLLHGIGTLLTGMGKAGQYIRTNSVLCHITLWLTKQPLHEWQRS